MPTGQQYATNVPQTFITGQINPTATVMSVNSSSGWPSVFPFTAVLEIGTSLQEPVDVTNISGTTWTIVRAIDGTVGFTHNPNATVTHADIGRDFRESRSHIDATTTPDATGHAVHGLTSGSSVVGTADSQTLTNKTMGASTSFTGTSVAMGSGDWIGTGQMSMNDYNVFGITGVNGLPFRMVGTVSNGQAPTTGTFNLGDLIYDTFYRTWWACTSAGSPGTWLPTGGRASSGLTAAGSINVPSWANTIRVVWNCRNNGVGSGGVAMAVQFNGDTGNNYLWSDVQGTVSTASAALAGPTTATRVGIIPMNGDTANYYGTGELVITNAQSNAFKTVSSFYQCPLSTSNNNVGALGGIWQSTAAITSLNLLPVTGAFQGSSNMTVEFLA